jgi:hypothetical protein
MCVKRLLSGAASGKLRAVARGESVSAGLSRKIFTELIEAIAPARNIQWFILKEFNLLRV